MMNVKSAIVLMFELAPKLGKEEAAILPAGPLPQPFVTVANSGARQQHALLPLGRTFGVDPLRI